MIDLLLIALLLLIGSYWSSGTKAREIAFMAVAMHCKKMDVVLLDDYVALNAQWLKRDTDGKVKVWRSYEFEFSSTGAERYQGKVILLGRKVSTIQLEAYRIVE